MSEFTTKNWLQALTDVYDKATLDPVYRQLCLTDPRAAIAQVSDIELPAGFSFTFVANREDYQYFYLLPPALRPAASLQDQAKELIDWATLCTNTDTTGTGP